MGFGSGGGFTPSPNNVPGSTKTGTDKDTDVHEFTGSVDITGSLTLNGSSVTGGGGGGGAVATYTNAGNDRVITSVNADTINGEASLTFDGTSLTSPQVTASVSMKAAVLQVSSSAEGALFRVDHETQSGGKPIIFVTGSGLVGIGTAAPRGDSANTNRVHILGEEGADQGQNPVQNTLLMLENDNHAGIQFITPNDKSGMIVWGDAAAARVSHFYYLHNDGRFHFDGATFGDEVMTILSSGDSINIGSSSSDHMITNKASLHISSSEEGSEKGGPVLLRVDHADQPGAKPILFVTGSGRVGIGTDDPSHSIHIKSPGKASLLLEADTDNTPETDTAYIKLTQDNSATRMIVGLNGNAGADPDGIFLANAMANAGVVGPRTAGSSLQLVTSNRAKIAVTDDGQVGVGDGFTQGTNPTAILHVSGGIGAQGTAKASPLMLLEYDDNDNILFVTGSGLVGIGTNAPVQTLSVSGSAAFSGAFGSSAVENFVTSTGVVNSSMGNTILDITGLGNNAFYSYGIADGSFAGQQKNLVFKANFGGASANTNGLQVTGSNIDTALPGTSAGVVIMSGSDGGGGYFQSLRGSAQLLWDGSKWQVLAVTNAQYSGA